MGSVAENINANLSALFDVEDELYLILISDPNGTIPAIISKPTDIEIGAIASQQEYLRQVSMGLLKQIFLDQASGEFLKYTLETLYDSIRLQGETDDDWVSRTANKIFSPKISKASIILALRPYSSQEPESVRNVGFGAFADYSFASRYRSFKGNWSGGDKWVYPAIARSASFSIFSVRITLYDTPSDDLNTVINLIEGILAPGISYELIIKTSGNKFNLQGNITYGLTLDILNAEGGTLPVDFVSYDDINYDTGTYGVTAVYTSLFLNDPIAFSELSSIGVGNVFFQYQNPGGPWSAEQDASGEKTFALSGNDIQYRFIFKSESWSDPDSIIVTGIS